MKVMPFTVPGLFNKTHFGRTGALNTHLLHFLCLIDDGYRKNGASGPFGYSYPIPVIVLYFSLLLPLKLLKQILILAL